MAIKCVAIDYEPLALQVMKGYIEKTAALQLVNGFEDAVTAAEFLRNCPVDLLFVDIQMPDINGLDLVRSIENKPLIIFSTAQRKFAFEGLELQAIDYLLKPVSFERFTKAVAKAEEYYKFKKSSPSNDEYLYVYSEYKLVKIDLDNIEFIESLEDYIRIHISNSKPILSLMPLKRVLQKLPPSKFQRVHRSYIVSVNKIKGVVNKRIILAAAQVPVSDSYLNAVRQLKKTL
ncbi:MAG TPA: LytTR family DNA-binding domain-containing protein [Flavitalea sp.]|nr:LytTR family DNA-binding domain-containing protein [Flavitalea sp.]